MSDGKQARILAVDDTGALLGVLRAAVALTLPGHPLALTPAKLSEAQGITRLERATDRPFSAVFLALSPVNAVMALEVGAQMAVEDGDLQLVFCPTVDHTTAADALRTRFGASDRVLLLHQPVDPQAALALMRMLSAKAELHRDLRAARAETAAQRRGR